MQQRYCFVQGARKLVARFKEGGYFPVNWTMHEDRQIKHTTADQRLSFVRHGQKSTLAKKAQLVCRVIMEMFLYKSLLFTECQHLFQLK